MSDNSDWITHRQPTANDEDSDYNRNVWVIGKHGMPVMTSFMNVKDGERWHPNPNNMPAPYKPPVPERVGRWAFVDSDGVIHGQFISRNHAEYQCRRDFADMRLAFFREVRDGDPAPEDVARAIHLITVTNTDFPESIFHNLRRAIELLGGKP